MSWSWVQSLGTLLFVLWIAKQANMYHNMTYPEWVEDLKMAPLPLNDKGFDFWLGFLKPYSPQTGAKRETILLHMKVSLALALALCFQFLKTVRQKAMPLHRIVGRVTLVGAFAALPGFAKLVSNFDMPLVQYMEYPVLVMIPYYGIKGWLQAYNKQIADHKASMIMFASCFFYFGVQRVVMILFGLLHSDPLGKLFPLGPWKQWDENSYEHFFNISVAWAAIVTFGLGGYKAYVVPAKSKSH